MQSKNHFKSTPLNPYLFVKTRCKLVTPRRAPQTDVAPTELRSPFHPGAPRAPSTPTAQRSPFHTGAPRGRFVQRCARRFTQVHRARRLLRTVCARRFTQVHRARRLLRQLQLSRSRPPLPIKNSQGICEEHMIIIRTRMWMKRISTRAGHQ